MSYKLFYLIIIFTTFTSCAGGTSFTAQTPAADQIAPRPITPTPAQAEATQRPGLTSTSTKAVLPTGIPAGDLAATMELVTEQLSAKYCLVPGASRLSITDNALEVSCAVSMGHSLSAKLTRFANLSEAEQAFQAGARDKQIERFYNYPLARQHQTDPNYPLHDGRRTAVWQAECWLIEVSAYNDTKILSAGPRDASEMIYQMITDYELLAYCGNTANVVETAAPSPPITAPAPDTPPSRNFSAAVEVVPSTTTLAVGETLTVTVSVLDQSAGCRFGVMEVTLSQDAKSPILEPKTIERSGGGVFSLTAINPGTVTLSAYAGGEHNCGYSETDWYWGGARGVSEPITVR